MAIEETFTQTSGMYSANNREFTISSADSTGFDFLRTSDVKVYLTPSGGTKTLKTETDDYTLDKATKKITFVPSHAVPPTNAVVTAQRVTAVSEAINTFQAGSAVTASALNDSLNQLRFNIQGYGTLTNSGSLSDTDKGDITVSNSGNTWTIDNDAVTGDKLANEITIANTLKSTGNFSVGSDKFNVTASNGNTTIDGTLAVDGVTTLSGALDANAGASIDNVQIGVTGDNEIDTASGNLTIDSAGGTTTVDDNAIITGTLGVTGEVTVNTGIIPDTDEGAYLGTVAKPFSQVMVGEIKIASTDDNTIDTVSGNLELDSATGTTVIDDNCNINGTLAVTGASTLTGPLILGTPPELTISSGSITVTTSYHTVDTESDAGSDNLDKIECAAYTTGQILILRSVHDDRDVVVRHNQHPGEDYNIACGSNRTLSHNEDVITLMWDHYWHMTSGVFDND